MQQLLLIGAGGFFGAIARFGLSGFAQRLFASGERLFPLGTLAVNVIGCFALGFLNQVLEERFLVRPEVRIALTVGFLGAFTTFSTYGFETFAMLNDGNWRGALLNFTLQNGVGLLAVFVGYRLAEHSLI